MKILHVNEELIIDGSTYLVKLTSLVLVTEFKEHLRLKNNLGLMRTIILKCSTCSVRLLDTCIETCKDNLFDIKSNTTIEEKNMMNILTCSRGTHHINLLRNNLKLFEISTFFVKSNSKLNSRRFFMHEADI